MEDFFRITFIPMFPVGFWPLPNDRRTEFLKKLNGFTSIFSCGLLGTVELWKGIDNFSNIVLLLETIVTATACSMACLKMFIFMKDRVFTRQMIEIINDLSENTPVSNDDEIILKATEFWKKRAHNLTKFIMCVFLLPYIYYNIVPWMKYYNTGVKEPQYPSKFPFDISTWPIYMVVYLFEFGACQMLIWSFVASNSFFATVVMFICSRLEILKYSITVATEEATNVWRATPLFGKSIEFHKTILRLCDMMEQFYSPPLLFQFFYSLLTICILCFLAIQQNVKIEKQITFLSFNIGMLVQLFIYCYYGQLLQDKFEELCANMFHCEWYDAPLSYQKDMAFLLARCYKPVTLTAYKIMPVNLESFFAIIKSSMSYFTMLQSMNNEE